MNEGRWSAKMAALALAGGLVGSASADAKSYGEHASQWQQPSLHKVRRVGFSETPASAAQEIPDTDSDRRQNGHMTPEERRLLRQHIEDAVRELYKR